MATGGPPRVAILVAMRSRRPPQAARSPVRVRARRLQWAGGTAGSAAAILVSSAGAGIGAAGASLCTEVSGDRDFRLRGLRRGCVLRLQRGDFLGLHPAPAAIAGGSAGAAAAGMLSAACCCAGSGSTRSIASTGVRVPRTLPWALRSAGQISAPAPRARRRCWQIPRGPRAAGPPHRARTPGPTSTARSRRTENGSRGAWTRFPPSQGAGKAFEPSGTR